MKGFREIKRRSVVPLAGLLLAIYYVFVFVPLSRNAAGLDIPVHRAWKRLATSMERTNMAAVDFRHITNQFSETREALSSFESARQKAASRIELSAAVKARMDAPFQLVDYENERSKQLDDLIALAKQKGIVLDPGALAGLPEHTAEDRQPEVLWAALTMANELVRSALLSKVAVIHSLQVPLALTNAAAVGEAALIEIPLHVELTGSFDSVATFMQLLPLKSDEAATAGFASGPEKPALFIDRLVMRKQTPQKPDEVRMALRAVGFVLRE